MYIPNITWNIIILKKCPHCLPAVKIKLGVLYFYLPNPATLPAADCPGLVNGHLGGAGPDLSAGRGVPLPWQCDLGQILSLNPHCTREV